MSTFVLSSNRAGVEITAPNLVFPTWISIFVCIIIIALAGIWQLVRGFGKRSNSVLIGMIALGLFAFLVWAARDKSFNLTGMLASSIILSTPIALAALSGIYSERAGEQTYF